MQNQKLIMLQRIALFPLYWLWSILCPEGEDIMKRLSNIFLSKLLNIKLYDKDSNVLGKIMDIAVQNDEQLPRIAAISLKGRDGSISNIRWADIDIYEQDNRKLHVSCTKVQKHEENNLIYLAKDLLDKQIVDINGRKVVRVNDLRITELNGAFKVVAVDVGFTGLLRRLGVEGTGLKLVKFFYRGLRDNLITWDNVEPLKLGTDRLTLTVPYKKLASLHPADIADILESLDAKYRNEVFQALDDETAANTLEEIEPDFQADILESLNEDRASNILDNMDNDEIADIFDDMEEDRVENLLHHMEKEDADEIRTLMNYEETTVGSLMNTEFISFSPGLTVEETINELRQLQPSSDITYYLYVVDGLRRLIGVVSLRSLIVATPSTKLASIMESQVISVKDTDTVENVTEIITKYDLLALPVVNDKNVMVGMAILSDIVDEVLLPRWKRRLKRAV
jgi:Mg/Co/Ni transporter MgtE (contains CBS domain)